MGSIINDTFKSDILPSGETRHRRIHCVSKTSYLWFATIFTHTVRLQQFLAKMLPRK